MGFKLNRTYTLKFEGTSLEGAEIRLRSASIGVIRQIHDAETDADLAEVLAPNLLGWNLEDADGNPLKTTAEAVITHLEPHELLNIVKAWVGAVTQVPPPLDGPSTAGGPSPEASIPMELLSESPAS